MSGKDIILGLLIEKGMSGYEINQVFESVFSHFYKTSYGMIYPTLKKLQKEVLVTKEVVFQEGKPNKNIFKTTSAGKLEFYKFLSKELSSEFTESEFMVKMYFGEYASPELIKSWIKHEIESKQKCIKQLKEDFKHWDKTMSFSQKVSYEIGIRQYAVTIDVLLEKLKELDDSSN